jgi:hypothetical protein
MNDIANKIRRHPFTKVLPVHIVKSDDNAENLVIRIRMQ